MYYLIDWRNMLVITASSSEQTCRDDRRRLVTIGQYAEGELVIAQGVE